MSGPSWEKKHWSPETQHRIYKDWGLYLTNYAKYGNAAMYYEKALSLKKESPWIWYLLSKAKRELGDTNDALLSGVTAATLKPNDINIRLELCRATYELNNFITTKLLLSSYKREFNVKKGKADMLLHLLNVVDANINDSLGPSWRPFIIKHSHILSDVTKSYMNKKSQEHRPRWKIMSELNKCDVLSQVEKEIIEWSPYEMAQREHNFKYFVQVYLDRSYMDVFLLRKLNNNANILLPYSKGSTTYLQKFMTQSYKRIWRFVKMLQNRSPLYNELQRKCTNTKFRAIKKEYCLNRIQYQTRRNMITILRNLHYLRGEGNLKNLIPYVENVMGDYVATQSHRVMPWKLEFIYDVYYIVAMAFADTFKESNNQNQLHTMLAMGDENEIRARTLKTESKQLFIETDKYDKNVNRLIQYIVRLEKRLKYAKFAIERCYIYHEIARTYIELSKTDESYQAARKLLLEAESCNSILWQFLGMMIKVKVHVSFFKRDRIHKALMEARDYAIQLKNQSLIDYIDLCVTVNNDAISLRKKNHSIESIRKKTRYNSQARISTLNESFI